MVIWYDLEWVYNDLAGGFLRGTYLMWLVSGFVLFFMTRWMYFFFCFSCVFLEYMMISSLGAHVGDGMLMAYGTYGILLGVFSPLRIT